MACIITYNNKKYSQTEFNEYFKSHFFEFAGDFLNSANISEVTLEKPRFNPDNYEATSYPIKINGKNAGIFSVDKDGYISSSIGMSGVDLNEEFQGKGYGTKVYLAVANKLAEEGKTLKSEKFGKNNINESANRVWKSLLNKSLAVDKGDYFEVVLGSKQDIEGFKEFVSKKINNIKADESINERLMKYEESIKIPNNVKSKVLEKIEKETEKVKEKLLSLGLKQDNNKFELITNSYATFKMKLKELENVNAIISTNKTSDFYQIIARLKNVDSTMELKKQGELPFTPVEVKQVIQEQQFLNDVADNVFEGLSEEEKQILKKKIENGDYDLNCRI